MIQYGMDIAGPYDPDAHCVGLLVLYRHVAARGLVQVEQRSTEHFKFDGVRPHAICSVDIFCDVPVGS